MKRRKKYRMLLLLFVLLPAGVLADGVPGSCVCDCVYLKNPNIKNYRYYAPGTGGSCQAIEGRACIGQLRGEQYRGSVENCDKGPLETSLPLAGTEHLRKVIYQPDLSRILDSFARR